MSAAPRRRARRIGGFTLIELAVVTAVIALLIGSILVPLTTQVETRRISDTQKTLDDVREALFGYALSRATTPYLPCPDKTVADANPGTANDGVEDVLATGNCVVLEGNVPWVTLGVGTQDAWGNRLRYRVMAGLSGHRDVNAALPAVTLTTAMTPAAGALDVCSAPPVAGTCAAATQIAINVPAVILSHGRNGYGAISATGGAPLAVPAANVDEAENLGTADRFYVQRLQTEATGGATEFDDIVSWVSANILFGRLVVGGRLP